MERTVLKSLPASARRPNFVKLIIFFEAKFGYGRENDGNPKYDTIREQIL